MNKEIVLIAYKFAPYSAIGAYRWRKIAKYMARLGVNVHVLTSKWSGDLPKDVIHENIKLHVLPSMYPNKLHFEVKYKNRILEFFRKAFVKIVSTMVFYNGESTFWESTVRNKIREISKSANIDAIIATGAPFHSNVIASNLKDEFKNTKIIQDFRDPWSKDPTLNMSPLFKGKLMSHEDYVLRNSDLVVSVSDMLLEEFLEDYPKTKGLVIYNGFDPEDYSEKEAGSVNNERLTLIHTGSVTNGRDIPLYKLFDAITESKIEDKVLIRLVGVAGDQLQQKIKSNWPTLAEKKTVEIIGRRPQAECFKMIEESDYALQLSAPALLSSLSTKIFEYAKLKKPTFCINYGGEIEKLLDNCSVGISINLNKNESLSTALEKILKGEVEDYQYNIDKYSHKTLAKEYLDAIEAL